MYIYRNNKYPIMHGNFYFDQDCIQCTKRNTFFLKCTLKYIIFKEDQFKWLRRHSGLDSREDFGKKK